MTMEEMIPMQNIIASVAVAVFVLYLLTFLKNQQALWNRYRNIPGPTPLPLLGSALIFLGLDLPGCFKKFQDLRTVYGKTTKMWVGNFMCLVVSEPDCIEKIFSSKSPSPRSQIVSLLAKSLFRNSIFLNYGEVWRSHRKIISLGFYNSVLDKFVVNHSKNAKIFADKLEKETKDCDVLNIYNYAMLCTSDISHETMLGSSLNVQKQDLMEYPQLTADFLNTLAERMRKPWLYPDFIFCRTKSGKRIDEIFEFFRGHARRVLEEETSKLDEKVIDKNIQSEVDTKTKSVLQVLLENGEMNEEEMVDELVTLILAGIETSATALCFVLALLAEHQDVQEKVIQEQWTIFGKNSQASVSSEDLNKMIYLEQVIKETLRLYPPAPFLYRSVTEDMDLGKGYHIPRGTEVIVLVCDIHRDPELYPDPGRFDPERFSQENSVGRHPYAYVPFGAGRRMCIGYKFAMMELKTLLSVVLRRHKMVETVGGLRDIENGLEFSLILKPTTGFNMKIAPRA